jgi:dTDP-4-amino-4,6-dideoxygalactose transaminase
MSVGALADKLVEAEKMGRLPKIVVPVHFAGQPCDMAAIGSLARKYGFAVIEDASHAVGATDGVSKVGSCQYSDVTILSFHPVKIMTTGEGGMLLTNRNDLDASFRLLRSHGVTRDPALMDRPADGPWYYQQIDLGYNYRITDFQAALGLSQFRRLGEFLERRRRLAEIYSRNLRGLPVTLPYQRKDVLSAWHLYVLRISETGTVKRSQVVRALHEAGIKVNVHYIPVHTQPYFRTLGFCLGDFPESERYYQEAISLPMYFGLTDSEMQYVADQVKRIVS